MTVAISSTVPSRRTAIVAVGAGADAASSLELALEQSNAAEELAAAAGGREPADCRVVVKAALPPGSAREDPPLSYADPALVQALAAWLAERGFRAVSIAVPGPDAAATAATVGYDAAVLDLASEPVPFHYGGLIGEHPAARVWRDADIRILVGKARTDRQLLYAGAMLGALGCVPDSDRLARRLPRPDDLARCACDVLAGLPVAFGVLDAWRAADGAGPPRRSGHARATGCVLASADLLALDWVLGELMDLDGPELSPVVGEALQRRGPIQLKRRGVLTGFDPWSNPGALRAVLASVGAGRWWGSLTGSKGVPWTAR
jgi:uncharacterized protein (DUF362 family)